MDRLPKLYVSELAAPELLAERTGLDLAIAGAFHIIFMHALNVAARSGYSLLLDGILLPANSLSDGQRELLEQLSSEQIVMCNEADGETFTEKAGLPAESIMTIIDVLGLIRDYSKLTDTGLTNAEIDELLDAALEAMDPADHPGSAISLRPVDLESNIEHWIVRHLDIVAEHLDLEDLALHERDGRNGRQWRFANAGRADLLCRAPDGMFVVIEVKAGMAQEQDVAQVENYVQAIIDDGLAPNALGVLISDGFTNQALQAAASAQHPIAVTTLVAIGYHDSRLFEALGKEPRPISAGMIDLLTAVGQVGLPVPPVPPTLARRVRRRRDDWWWHTGAEIDPLDLYSAAGGDPEVALPGGDWFAFGVLGHGLQSNFLVYALSIDGVLTISRTPWGNAYGEPQEEKARAAHWLQGLADSGQ